MRTVMCVALLGMGLGLGGAGCGGDPATTGGDGGTGADSGPSGTVNEAETATGSNDDMTTAESMKLGDRVLGTVQAAGTAPDKDFYKFSITAPTAIRVTLAARSGGDYQTFGRVVFGDINVATVVRGGSDPKTGTREAYLSRPGTYYVQVSDLRNIGASPANVGGATFTYELTVVATTVTPVDVTLPLAGASQNITVPADGKLTVYSFNVANKHDRIKAETRASRLTPASDVDTLLFFMNATATPTLQVDYSDDISAGSGITDSLLEQATPDNGKHLMVVDFADIKGPARNLTLTIENLGP